MSSEVSACSTAWNMPPSCADHVVQEKTYGVKRVAHPVAGLLDFGYETLALPGDADQAVVVYTATPGTATAERLAVPGSWTADDSGERTHGR
jgi:hypothetical protein